MIFSQVISVLQLSAADIFSVFLASTMFLQNLFKRDIEIIYICGILEARSPA